jgi:hypothetical protein
MQFDEGSHGDTPCGTIGCAGAIDESLRLLNLRRPRLNRLSTFRRRRPNLRRRLFRLLP